ncbi:carboxyl-terminal processing protease CtpB [Acaryochloris marina NIES-2412]|uniref:carboxyl-terminal processing protease CtpB n=1 Tax=Acaryochloris marina TaxID=155978 RepID=UPI00405868B9
MNQLFKLRSTTRSHGIWKSVVLVPATAITFFQPCLTSEAQATLEDSPKVVLDEAWQLVNRYYVDGTFNQKDWQATRQTLLSDQYASKQHAYSALRKALAVLDDPYTRFMSPQEFKALTTQTSGQLSGIGIRLEQNETTNAITIIKLLPNAPALKAGLKVGDRIVAIDGNNTDVMDLKDASSLIRGEIDTAVKLRISRAGQDPFDMDITRDVIELPTVHTKVKQEGNNRVGYIRLLEFSAHASEQMKTAIEELEAQKVDGFVLDLRGNPGGLLNASIEIAEMWLNRGFIVHTIDRKGKQDDIRAHPTALTKRPLVVLVDGDSASSSEILTGALQDNHRAKVIGTSTFGKALVQSVHKLSDGSGIAITVSQYFTPNGTDISHTGITPDIPVKLTPEQLQTLYSDPSQLATFNDPQYMQAIRSLQQSIHSHNGQNQNSVAVPKQNIKTESANHAQADPTK